MYYYHRDGNTEKVIKMVHLQRKRDWQRGKKRIIVHTYVTFIIIFMIKLTSGVATNTRLAQMTFILMRHWLIQKSFIRIMPWKFRWATLSYHHSHLIDHFNVDVCQPPINTNGMYYVHVRTVAISLWYSSIQRCPNSIYDTHHSALMLMRSICVCMHRLIPSIHPAIFSS